MILDPFKQRYGLGPEVKLLSDWHAATYEVSRASEPAVLRITAESHRSAEDIRAELEWMEYLAGRGVRVPAILKSKQGSTFEQTTVGEGNFTAVLFEKLMSRPVADDDLRPDLFVKWGELVGRLHRLTKDFKPSSSATRKAWHESDFLNVEKYVPDALSIVWVKATSVIKNVRDLPKRPENYGLMHADVYQDNFFLGQHGLELFDFDNAEHGFLINDIAIALYAYLWRVPEESNWPSHAAAF